MDLVRFELTTSSMLFKVNQLTDILTRNKGLSKTPHRLCYQQFFDGVCIAFLSRLTASDPPEGGGGLQRSPIVTTMRRE